jgi:hypothetical protein
MTDEESESHVERVIKNALASIRNTIASHERDIEDAIKRQRQSTERLLAAREKENELVQWLATRDAGSPTRGKVGSQGG